MENPFEIINKRLSNIESLVLSISHRLPEKITNSETLEELLTLETSIDDIDIGVREYNAFKANDVKTVRDIMNLGQKGLKKLRNIGPSSVLSISNDLRKIGFDLPYKENTYK
jgi:DNA-directed RNA polymerase alpha subunit